MIKNKTGISKEKAVAFNPNFLEFYNPTKNNQGSKKKYFYYTKKNKQYHFVNLVILFFSVSFLLEVILIAQKLEGALTRTSWYLIFIPFIADCLVLLIFILSLEPSIDSCFYSTLVMGYFLSIILSVASKLENIISSRYVIIKK